MGRDYRSHINKSQHPGRTFKTSADFFILCLGRLPQNHCAAGYFAAFAADLSDAIDGGESFSARLTEALSADGSSDGVFSPPGLPETEASGTAGRLIDADQIATTIESELRVWIQGIGRPVSNVAIQDGTITITFGS